MAEIATIARPWAEAVFQAARDAGAAQLEATAQWVDELGALAADAQLQAFAASPARTDQQVFDVLAGLVRSDLGPQGRNFLQHVIAQKRVAALPEMAQQFRALKNAQAGVQDAQVSSAFALDAAQTAALQQVLQRKFGRDLVLHISVKPELIGGVRVQVGDEVLDTSVAARLQQMKASLLA